ncbi:MAG TPA: membrane protein insertase YidC [Terracidiphilus sp.]|nr:membrane protein insertase YidC [Terracidiphilus sp.]
MAEFNNPNLPASGGSGGGSGGDMRGLMTMTLLALVVLLAFQFLTKPKQTTPAPAAQTPAQTQPQPAQPAATQAQPAQPQPAARRAPAHPVSTNVIAASAVEKTTVENENLKIVFTNRGAQVEHWILKGKQYKDHPDPGGQQLDLVNSRTAALGLPLSLFTYEPELTKQLNEAALYQVTTNGMIGADGALQAPASITFHYAANGLDVVKTFRFDASYVVTAEVEVHRDGVPVRALLAWPGGLGDQTEAMHFSYGKFVWSLDGKDDSLTPNPSGFLFWSSPGVSGGATLTQPYDYAAVSDLYFAAAFLPDAPARTTVVTLHNQIELPTDPSDPNSQKKPADVLGLAVGDISGSTRVRLFAGPKETDLLKAIHSTGSDGKPTGPTLEPLIQFGWLTIIAKPLYLALRYLRIWMGPGAYNWGWAIIIVTVIFNLLMLPTRFMMMKSSLKMMRIQPKVEAIKQRYKHLKPTDPKRAEMNTEMMALYKAEGVNMYGSCLPMLIQMPLFFAYYRVLLNAVELRQAPWFWLTDLSTPDPKYILPILIIVTMFIVQLITPSPGMDPTQRKMMAIMMPAIFGFTMLHFASGLALYWCTMNIISLAIQLGINQSSIGKEMHEISARRAAKKAGINPKTIQGKR